MKNLVSLLAVTALAFTGCVTDPVTGKKTFNPLAWEQVPANRAVTNAVLQDVFNTVLTAGLSAGGAALMGQNGQDAAQAAFIAAGESNGVNALGTLLTAYAGPQIAPVANAAIAALTKAQPVTPADKVAVLNTIGAAIQTAANEQFSKDGSVQVDTSVP